jgi:hypothetical protein
MKRIGQVFLILIIGFSFELEANLLVPNLKKSGVMERPNNNMIDPEVDYENFIARVSDRSDDGRILKLKVENNNTKFLRAGDQVTFTVNETKARRPCRASVRSVEDFYFSIYVSDFNPCWSSTDYFRRGTQLNLNSTVLAQRILEASYYRDMLIMRKDGFLKQLSQINNFIHAYDQHKIKLAAEFDEKINQMLQEKQKSLDNLIRKKQESIILQTELMNKLNNIDSSLDHYRVDRREQITDRWNVDHDTGLPFGDRPQSIRK